MIIRTVKLKLFQPGNKKFFIKTVVAGPGKRFTAAGIEKILADFVDKVDAAMPDRYNVVQVGPGAFNFVRITPEPVFTGRPGTREQCAESLDRLAARMPKVLVSDWPAGAVRVDD